MRRSFAEREPMVPLTNAAIAYMVGGVLEVVDATTLIVTRELAVRYREAEVLPATGPARLARLARPGSIVRES